MKDKLMELAEWWRPYSSETESMADGILAILDAEGDSGAVNLPRYAIVEGRGGSVYLERVNGGDLCKYADVHKSAFFAALIAEKAGPADPPAGVPDEWREDVALAAQMLTWGADEGLTTSQERDVRDHQAKLFNRLAAAPSAPEGGEVG